MDTIVSSEVSPAMGQLTPLIVTVFLAISTATAREDRSFIGLTCLLCWINSTVPQHDNRSASAFASETVSANANARIASDFSILFVALGLVQVGGNRPRRKSRAFPIVSQVEIRAICPLEITEAHLSKERDSLAKFLEDQRGAGMIDEQTKARRLAEFDALEATKAMPIYALASTLVAAISAIASAAAAYFAYAALHVPH